MLYTGLNFVCSALPLGGIWAHFLAFWEGAGFSHVLLTIGFDTVASMASWRAFNKLLSLS